MPVTLVAEELARLRQSIGGTWCAEFPPVVPAQLADCHKRPPNALKEGPRATGRHAV